MGSFWALIREHFVGIAGIFLSALYMYLQIQVWKKHGDDVTMQALGIVGTMGLWAFLLIAIARYWRDANRSETAKSKLLNAEYEHGVQMAGRDRAIADLRS